MSRRIIFLLTATAVVLYFSIILFMLNPLHSARGMYTELKSLNFRRVPIVEWCKKLEWRKPSSPNVTALVSAPGSGNTWLRYLLQQATGVLTGSIYMDHDLRLHGFPAENVDNGSVLVVKTHAYTPEELNKYKAAVILVRNPRDALLADFNRIHKGHTGTVSKAAFKKKTHKNENLDWDVYVSKNLNAWESLHINWLSNFSWPMHFVFYDDLVHNTKRTIRGILDFLNYNVSQDDIICALRHKEGVYRRTRKQDFDPFTPAMYTQLSLVRSRIYHLITMFIDYQRENITNKQTAIRALIKEMYGNVTRRQEYRIMHRFRMTNRSNVHEVTDNYLKQHFT